MKTSEILTYKAYRFQNVIKEFSYPIANSHFAFKNIFAEVLKIFPIHFIITSFKQNVSGTLGKSAYIKKQ